MNDSHKTKCHAIIHGAATICACIGFRVVQIVGKDNEIIVPIQVSMIISLGAVFGVDLNESTAKGYLVSQTTTMIGRGITQALVGSIPHYGNAINAATAFAVTELIGWAIVKDFGAKITEQNWR